MTAMQSKTIVQPRLGGAFSMPIISPEIPAPPYRFKDTKVTNILFKTDSQVLEKLVPPPLKPNQDQCMVFYIGHFQFADYDFSYHEAGLLVPVIHNGKSAGYYAVILYLDQFNPIVGGREVYGWPKTEAEQIVIKDENGKTTASVTRYEKQIIQASFETQQKVYPIPERPKDIHYLLKLIPSAQKGAPPDVLKLISTVIDPDEIKELRVGQGTLEFGDSPFDSFLTQIPVKEVVYGETIVHDFTLGYGEVVVDYLAGGQK